MLLRVVSPFRERFFCGVSLAASGVGIKLFLPLMKNSSFSYIFPVFYLSTCTPSGISFTLFAKWKGLVGVFSFFFFGTYTKFNSLLLFFLARSSLILLKISSFYGLGRSVANYFDTNFRLEGLPCASEVLFLVAKLFYVSRRTGSSLEYSAS